MHRSAGGAGAPRRGRVDCFRCRHFFVTWDPAFPRGCRAMGFKGRRLPSQVVREASGAECLRFEDKGGGGGAGQASGSGGRR
ncbi:MAG: hypothetical protein Kow0092_07340 [Deferrisomatales bacterium]